MTEPERAPLRRVRRLREVLGYANRFVQVFDDEVEFRDGSPGRYLRIEHVAPGVGVVVLPVHGGSVGLVHTYRYPVGAWEWGLPRGFAQDLDPLVTARGELREELGVEAEELRQLGLFTPDSGLLASRVAVVLARVGDPVGRPQDVQEVQAVRWVPVTELWQLVAIGELQDGMTLAALALAQAAGALPTG